MNMEMPEIESVVEVKSRQAHTRQNSQEMCFEMEANPDLEFSRTLNE